MKITEVRMASVDEEKLRAYCSVTFDNCFVVQQIRIIRDTQNNLFVAMPSRKMDDHCNTCGAKNHRRAAFCNQCGMRLRSDTDLSQHRDHNELYADVAFPINNDMRNYIQQEVLKEYYQQQPPPPRKRHSSRL